MYPFAELALEGQEDPDKITFGNGCGLPRVGESVHRQ